MSVTRRNRSLPPLMWTEVPLLELSTEVRMTGIGLHWYVDDEGRGDADPRFIRSSLWPLAEEITTDVIDEHLTLLELAGYLVQYEIDGRWYLALTDWPSVDRGAKSRIGPPPLPREDLATSSRAARDILAVVERERREGGSERGERGRGGEGEEAPALALVDQPRPSPFCTKHPSGTERACRPCGTARLRHDEWLRAQADDAATDIEEAAR